MPYQETSRKRRVAPRKSPLQNKKLQATEFMIAHPEATLAEVAEKFKISKRTIEKCRQLALEEGLVTEGYWRRPSISAENGENGVSEPVKRILHDDQLSTEESLIALTELARAAQRDGANKLAIDAHNAFHKLKNQSKEAKLGPAPPLSYDEKVERTSRILECVGIRALKAAFEVAFPDKIIEITDPPVVLPPPEPEKPWPPTGLGYQGQGDIEIDEFPQSTLG